MSYRSVVFRTRSCAPTNAYDGEARQSKSEHAHYEASFCFVAGAAVAGCVAGAVAAGVFVGAVAVVLFAGAVAAGIFAGAVAGGLFVGAAVAGLLVGAVAATCFVGVDFGTTAANVLIDVICSLNSPYGRVTRCL